MKEEFVKEIIIKDKVVKEKSQKKPPQILKYMKRLLACCCHVLRSPYTQVLLVFLCLAMISLCFFFMLRLSAMLDKRITEETERNAANLVLTERRLLNRTETAEKTLLAAVADSSEETLQLIRRLDTTYQGLLDAQKRRTLESFYNEDVLATERREAAVAFAAGRYVTASRIYGEIAAAHPEDHDARFFQYYALFLNNKMNRDNYRLIQDGMALLERQGYTRRELTETLNFINAETSTVGERQ